MHAHEWPSEVVPDSTCERCGLIYEEWGTELEPDGQLCITCHDPLLSRAKANNGVAKNGVIAHAPGCPSGMKPAAPPWGTAGFAYRLTPKVAPRTGKPPAQGLVTPRYLRRRDDPS